MHVVDLRIAGGCPHELRRSSAPQQELRAIVALWRASVGTRYAIATSMAAVLALVMLPIIISVGFFLESNSVSVGVLAVGAVFAGLAILVLRGTLSVIHDTESPETR